MKIVRWVPSFPRTRESIFVTRTLDSGVRRNDGQETSRYFHPFVRPGKAMVIPAQARPARGRGVHPRRGGSRTAPTMSPQARELLPRYALFSSLRCAPFGMTSLRRCAVLRHLVPSTQSVNELPDTYMNDISCQHWRVSRLPSE